MYFVLTVKEVTFAYKQKF